MSETEKTEILQKKGTLFNSLGKGGWNAFHFAIFFGHNAIAKEFLSKYINKIQIKIFKDFKIFKYFKEIKDINFAIFHF